MIKWDSVYIFSIRPFGNIYEYRKVSFYLYVVPCIRNVQMLQWTYMCIGQTCSPPFASPSSPASCMKVNSNPIFTLLFRCYKFIYGAYGIRLEEEIERVALRKISSEKFFVNRPWFVYRLKFIVARDIRQRYSYGVI